MRISRLGLLGAALLVTGFLPRLPAAVIERQGHEWILATGLVRKVVRLHEGRLTLASFCNQTAGREYFSADEPSPEFRFTADGVVVTGQSGGWTLSGNQVREIRPGQWQLDLALQREGLAVEKHYVAYENTPIIREWVTITNRRARPVRIEAPCALAANLLATEAAELDLSYVTGGANFNGSQLLKTEPMSATYARVFDSQVRQEAPVPRGDSYGSFLPLLVQRNRCTGDGLMAGWDYLGHWTLQVGADAASGTRGNVILAVAGYAKDLAPGGRIDSPKAFIGAFTGDLDAMGNALLDWQYAYLWEYTNDAYFARTRWAVRWTGAWMGDGGTPSGDNWGRRLADDLRYVDLMREVGGDVLWDDAGWYDRYGSWQAPDWRLTNDYVAKHGMRWLLWFPTFLATPTSRIGQEHPDWLVPGGLSFEQSIRATVEWQADLLAKSVKAWGDFQWRYDGMPAFSANDTDYLQADQNFRWLVETFKTAHPNSGVDACHGGGRWISYDLARLAESGEYTDGGVGPYSGYYTSLLIPPDKYHNIVDTDHTFYRPASDHLQLCMDPTWYCDPGDGADLASIRRDWDLYHYLRTQGVVGRWSHVFRPAVTNDDPIWYFERMDRAHSKGVIIVNHEHEAPVYFLTAKRVSGGEKDGFQGVPSAMCQTTTTADAALEAGVYQDPVDGEPRYYGSGGEIFGPVNLKYQAAGGEASFITGVVKPGAVRPATDRGFGLALRPARAGLVVTELGLISRTRDEWRGGALNNGKYRLSLVRAADRQELAAVELDLAQGNPDRLGFKYARLATPVRLESALREPVVVHPRGLNPEEMYDVSCARSDYRARRTGADLMTAGIEFAAVLPGELIFLNLPRRPGGGTDHTPPSAPVRVTKRIASNLGVQGVEVRWEPATDDNWISGYEILRDGEVQARSATSNFYFDYHGEPGPAMTSRYEVRAVDGDGNRSGLTTAQALAGEPPTYQALGGYSATQGGHHWRYEEIRENGPFQPMRWGNLGYEGLWWGSGAARIGRIWMQPGAASDVARVFVVPARAALSLSGAIRKDPSAENGRAVQVRVLLNDRTIWPASGWATIVPESGTVVECHVDDVPVVAGDSLRFVARRTGQEAPDPILWDPVVVLHAPVHGK